MVDTKVKNTTIDSTINHTISIESSRIPEAKAPILQNEPGSKYISTKNGWFTDASGRVMILHGINLGGSSKVPFAPEQPTHIKDGFFEKARTVSFVNRPFPLNKASTHFKRLSQWGFKFIRLIITWEAIEHEGPGIYDEDYLNYIVDIVSQADEHGINIFIDPHQDVWSRFTGGDGAPLWTLEIAGFNPQNFSETGAAVVHNTEGDPFPTMIWGTNNSKLAASTMFTLFFGGKTFAPNLLIDGVNIQDYLQEHYINAIKKIAHRLTGYGNVIGFDTMNEPSAGYIGQTDLNKLNILRKGPMPTAFEGMVAGGGNTVKAKQYKFTSIGPIRSGSALINEEGMIAWQSEKNDIWRNLGIWDYNSQHKPVLLKPQYFAEANGKVVDFEEDYYKPFILRFAEEIKSIDSNWLIFAEPALFKNLPNFTDEESKNMVNATHWYDGLTLMNKRFNPIFAVDAEKKRPVLGRRAIARSFTKQIARIKEGTKQSMGNQPTLIGEFGVPFDMNQGEAFTTGNFAEQTKALDRTFKALEANRLSYTLWNYTADNTNERGDGWNGEDLSIFSPSQQQNPNDINSGGRALDAAIRPYPYKIAGTPIKYSYNYKNKAFKIIYKPDPVQKLPTEIFLPILHYGKGFEVIYSGGELKFDSHKGILLHYPKDLDNQFITIQL
jgi:hypothetical protein